MRSNGRLWKLGDCPNPDHKEPEMAAEQTKPNIVLVHGAWADGSCWGDVIGALQAKGY